MKTPKELTLEDAQKMAEQSDYAFAACETGTNPINWGDAAAFVREGYKACFNELTRWNDPKEMLPEYYKAVEVKYKRRRKDCISAAWLSIDDVECYLWTIEGTNFLIDPQNIIGWRTIYE